MNHEIVSRVSETSLNIHAFLRRINCDDQRLNRHTYIQAGKSEINAVTIKHQGYVLLLFYGVRSPNLHLRCAIFITVAVLLISRLARFICDWMPSQHQRPSVHESQCLSFQQLFPVRMWSGLHSDWSRTLPSQRLSLVPLFHRVL